MNVEVSYGVPRRGVPTAHDFRDWIGRAAAALEEAGRVSLRIVDAVEGARLNRDFRGRTGATNVLSFPADLRVLKERFLGDIVLCAPRVAAEARAWGRPVSAHYAHLTIHGLLHLLGYDHERPIERRRMESVEIRLLGSLGLPDPYRRVPPAAARSAS
ncbi:protein belonging to Uncharacterized protein family UPF0054 [mine drainage metagenome]|uniref:Protein belonging to Uncharacterized protein family UPF0054 n=1 Tax=mine drainage metagenome TaxID=410659 RepID=T1BFV5_9ZZZZ